MADTFYLQRLNILDECIQYSMNEGINFQNIKKRIGSVLSRIIEAIKRGLIRLANFISRYKFMKDEKGKLHIQNTGHIVMDGANLFTYTNLCITDMATIEKAFSDYLKIHKDESFDLSANDYISRMFKKNDTVSLAIVNMQIPRIDRICTIIQREINAFELQIDSKKAEDMNSEKIADINKRIDFLKDILEAIYSYQNLLYIAVGQITAEAEKRANMSAEYDNDNHIYLDQDCEDLIAKLKEEISKSSELQRTWATMIHIANYEFKSDNKDEIRSEFREMNDLFAAIAGMITDRSYHLNKIIDFIKSSGDAKKAEEKLWNDKFKYGDLLSEHKYSETGTLKDCNRAIHILINQAKKYGVPNSNIEFDSEFL